MEEKVKVINKVGKDLSVKIGNADGIIEVTVEYPQAKVKLSQLYPGDVFRADGVRYVVLEHFSNGTAAVIRKEPLQDKVVFDFDSNDWKISSIRKSLNSRYLENLKEVFGESNIMNHTTDLLSLDGLGDYGKCIDKVGLLSVWQYQKYRVFINDTLYESEDTWWLVTPDSTASGFGANGVLHVGSMGDIGCSVCNFSMNACPYFVLRDIVMVILEDHVGGSDERRQYY